MQDDAIRLLELGFSVIPIRGGDKRPLVSWAGYQTQRASPDEVRAWFAQWPDAQIGIVTGPVSGVDVLDIDPGADISALNGLELPTGLVVKTPRNGRHHYFDHVPGLRNSASAVAHKIDVRAEGGYVVAPPSAGYAVEYGAFEDARERASAELVKLLSECTRNGAEGTGALEVEPLLQGVPEGQRDATAARLAGRYLALGMNRDEALLMLHAWNARNQPPLHAEDIEKVVTSIARRELLKRGTADGGTSHADVCKAFSDAVGVEIERVRILDGQELQFEFTIGGRPYYLSARQIGMFAAWRTAVIQCAAQVPRPIGKSPGWDYWINQLMVTAEHVTVDEDGYLSGQMSVFIGHYLEENPPAPTAANHDVRHPRVYENGIWVSPTAFRAWLNTKLSVKINHGGLLQIFSGLGYERRVVSVSINQGRRSTAVLYKTPQRP